MEYGIGDKSATDLTLSNDDDWWNSLTTVLKECFTNTRIGLEVGAKGDSEIVYIWTLNSAADILSSGDGNCKLKVIKFVSDSSNGIQHFLKKMEAFDTPDFKTRETISKILRELVNPKNGKLRSLIIKQAIAVNYLAPSVSILKELMQHRNQCRVSEEKETVESTIVNFLWFLSAVATNDSSFAMKVREMLKVKFFHNDIYKKIFFAKSSAHYPLLKILRQLSRNELTCKILGKGGIMNTIRKSFTTIGNVPGGKLLVLMDMLSQLTKKRNNSIRCQKAGLVVKLMQCFSNWELWKGKGLLRLSKFLISIYNHVARSPSGRKAITKCDAILQLRKFCEACPSEKVFDDVIMRCAGLIATCYGKDQLPLDSLQSPIVFQIPDLNDIGKLQDSGTSSDDEGSDEEDEKNNDAEEEEDSDNGMNDSVDGESSNESEDSDNYNDDDDEEDEEIKCKLGSSKASFITLHKTQQSRRSTISAEEQELMSLPKSTKPAIEQNQLLKYQTFFKEFANFGVINKKSSIRTKTPLPTSSEIEVDENSNEATKRQGIPKTDHNYAWITDNKDCKYDYWESIDELRRQYLVMANSVKRVAPFVKLSYPDFAFAYSLKTTENMLPNADRSTLRYKLLKLITKFVGGHSFKAKCVYDLAKQSLTDNVQHLQNHDEKEVLKGINNKKVGLNFEARFESGNLRKAIQVSEREYDLILTSDINTSNHTQWFYFEVRVNQQNDKLSTFNIINCTKSNSLFNYGMQPVMFSVKEALKGRPGWTRCGSEICYFKNGYKYVSKKRNGSKVYHTLSFGITFPHKGDIVYIAYHIPYTYSRLMVELNVMLKAVENREDITVNYDVLCRSLNKNDVPVLTITGPVEENSVNNRQIIFLTSRVHPGETNSSWVMKGILEFLLFGKTYQVNMLLKNYVFKIVPMLNIEGVINGCHRCGLTSEDLNRCWKSPSEILHPTIYHTKMLIEYCCSFSRPVLYCDLHGHSRRKNLFFYGCSYSKSWYSKDKSQTEDMELLTTLPDSMNRLSPSFCLAYCNYAVLRSRETTARVTVWRDFKINQSFTLECSYCGCDRGIYKGIAFGTNHLLEMGKDLCKACLDLCAKK